MCGALMLSWCWHLVRGVPAAIAGDPTPCCPASRFVRRGRLTPPLGCHTVYDMKRTSAVLSVSVPPDSAREFERLAEREGRNKSELFREMLAVYLTYQETRTFESLQRYGASAARRAGVHDESDVERLIQESRGQ